MSAGKPLNVLVGSLTQEEKETLAGIIQEADIARLGGSKKNYKELFREQKGNYRGKLKKLCSILGKQATDTRTVLDIFHNEMTRQNNEKLS